MQPENTPYKLNLTIESGRDLPIGDLTTSDPFVKISVGGKEIGRTKTILKNHRNPEWRQCFFVGLFHVNQKVFLEVFDEDRKQNELLGTVTIDLRSVLVIAEHQVIACDLSYAGRFKQDKNKNAKIIVDILLTRTEGLIRVLPHNRVLIRRQKSQNARQKLKLQSPDTTTSVSTSTKFLSNSSKSSKLPKPASQDENDAYDDDSTINYDTIVLLQDDPWWNDTHDLVKTTFMDIASESFSSSLNIHMLRDLMYDVLSVKTNDKAVALQYAQPCFKRFKQRFVSSTKIVFPHVLPLPVGKGSEHPTKPMFCRFSPLEENSIQINLSLDDATFILLTFSNRFLMWTWCKWLQLMYGVWTGSMRSSEVPDWASGHEFVCHCSLMTHQTERRHGKVGMYCNRPFVLCFDNAEIDVLTMSSMILANDSVVPKGYTLEVKFVMDTNFDRPGSVSNRYNRLVAQCRDETFRMNRNDENTTCFIDFSLDDLGETTSQSFTGRLLSNVTFSGGNSTGGPILLPTAPISKLAFDLFLLRGPEGVEKVFAQTKCHVDHLITADARAHGSMLMTLDDQLGTPTLKEIEFSNTKSKSVSLQMNSIFLNFFLCRC
jgi:hypothetical protein